jgi:hypothetical protein
VSITATEKENATAANGNGDPLLLHTLGVSPSLPGVSRPEDNIVKRVVSAFVDLGACCPRHGLVIAGERGWLNAQTRWTDMPRQAMAAKRWGAGGDDLGRTRLLTDGARHARRRTLAA